MVAATGIGSGLDIESLVSGLVNAERVPAESRLIRQETQITSEISAFGSLRGAVSSVETSLITLSNADTFAQRSAVSSNSGTVSVSATQDAATGSFALEIDQLANAQSLATGSFGAIDEVVGEGTLTFRFGTVTVSNPTPETQSVDSFELNSERNVATLTVDSSNNTLEGLRDAINEADFGVEAVIVNDGSGFRLLLSSDQTGAANSIEIQVNDTGGGTVVDNTGLSRLAFSTGGANLTQTVAAQDALFNINGLDISSASNTVSDALDGLSLTLQETTEGSPVTVTVQQNGSAARAAIDGLVNSYNAFIGLASQLTAYDPETNAAGPLQGDFTARTVISQLRSTITSTGEDAAGAFSSLSEIGIRTQADGSLSVDESALSDAIADNIDDLASLFARVPRLDDDAIEVSLASSSTVTGSFDVNVTRLATQGELLGAAITAPSPGTPLDIDADNDDLQLAIDGNNLSISLTQGAYESGAALATELQSRINGALAEASVGSRVTVEFTAGNALRILSNEYGSDSTVAITSVDTNAAELGLSVAAGTTGEDVAGTIGGQAATGTGQTLRADDDTEAQGVTLLITGGAVGARGTLSITEGLATRLTGVVRGLLESDGVLDARSDGLQSRIEGIEDDRESLSRRLEALEARYRREFNALDVLLANIQSTGDFVLQQLSALPIPGQDNDR